MTHTYAKIISRLFATSAILLVTTACGSLERDNTYRAVDRGGNSYVEAALVDQGDLSKFYQALHTTGVANELSDNEEYTIFAPTNAAFNQIKPRVFPCFYAVQCRPQLAAVLRNHIVPRNESIRRLSRRGSIQTVGGRPIEVVEPFLGHYAVDGNRVLYLNESNTTNVFKGSRVSLYKIDGVIAADQEIAPFRVQPVAEIQGQVIERTVTTYRPAPPSPYYIQPMVPGTYLVPGGYHVVRGPTGYMGDPADVEGNATETTTITRTTTTE
jgi:uncharacterized surface protein with fasciclin (FAS1) repeats